MVGSAAPAAANDNMYKTSNASWNCWDGTMSDGLFCQTDNRTLTAYFQDSATGNGVASTTKGRLALLNSNTVLSVSYPATAEYSGSAETDIIYQVSSSGFSGTTIGQTWCNDASSSTQCDQEYIRFRAASYVDDELACHETGHAVGLTHGADAGPSESNTASELGCMETPDYGSRTTFGSHNIDEINNTY
jgi:hypothetical protein